MVNIGGAERPVKFTNNALIELSEDHGVDILNGFDTSKISAKAVRAVCFIGLKYGAIVDKKEVDFTIEDVGNWLDTSDGSMTADGAMGQIFKRLIRQSKVETKGEPSKGE